MTGKVREGFTDAENAWLDEVASRHQPLTIPQIAMLRRFFRDVDTDEAAAS